MPYRRAARYRGRRRGRIFPLLALIPAALAAGAKAIAGGALAGAAGYATKKLIDKASGR